VFSVGTEDRLFERNGVPFKILHNDSNLGGQPNSLPTALRKELHGFDLIHIHQSMTVFGAYAVSVARSLKIPVIGTDLGGGSYDLMLRGSGIELFDGLVSISNYAAELVGTLFSGPHKVLIGPVDTHRFSPVPEVSSDRHRVLCVSRIMPHKGLDRVIAALPEGLSLTLVGRVYHDEYYELIRKMANQKDVTILTGATDGELLRLYRTSGLFVQASTTKDIYGNPVSKPELMGLTTLEAMACGLPAVVSNAGSLPELVPDKRFGRVFANHEELCAILRDYANGAWPGPGAGNLARQHVIAEHSMETIGRRLADFYRTVRAACAERAA
jgi:glycosyltransferase involved in cell wall biosynthesis